MTQASTAKWSWVMLSRRGWRYGEPLDDVRARELLSVMRRAFEVLRDGGILPERDMVIAQAEIKALCALSPGYLDPSSATSRVVLKQKEAAARN